MHQRFKLCAAVTGVALLLALPGCGGQRETGGAQATEAADPTHIYEEVQDNLLIDAEVNGPPEGVVPKVYAGEIKTFTQEEIDAFLAWNDDAIAEVTDDYSHDSGIHIYVASCQSGSKLVQESSTQERYPTTFSYTNIERYSRYGRYMIYENQWRYDQDSENCTAYMFTEPVDLPFATAQEAESEVRDALRLLGLDNLVLNRTLYLGHDRLEETGRVLQDEKYKEYTKDGVYPVWDDWSEEHDCYMFEFFSAADGIPMTSRGWHSPTVSYGPNDIMVWYTPHGIVALSILYPWSFTEPVETPESIVSATDALNTAREKLVNTISSEERVIDRIELVYIYEQDGDGWLLRPMWEVAVRKPSPVVDDMLIQYDYTQILIDALTGLEY